MHIMVSLLSTSHQCNTRDHQQHRVDFDEAICGWLPCDCAVDFAANQDRRQGHNDQGGDLDNSVGQHQLLHPATILMTMQT